MSWLEQQIPSVQDKGVSDPIEQAGALKAKSVSDAFAGTIIGLFRGARPLGEICGASGYDNLVCSQLKDAVSNETHSEAEPVTDPIQLRHWARDSLSQQLGGKLAFARDDILRT